MLTVVFLLTPEFSLTNVATAIDTLRVANSLLSEPRYRWRLATDTKYAVPSSCGLTLTADVMFSEVEEFDLLLVCGSFMPQEHVNEQTQRQLRRFARYGRLIGSMEAGAYHVALSGAFDGHRVSVHYANLSVYAQLFPNVKFRNTVYSVSERRVSCAGGLTGMDLMLHIIRKDFGPTFALRTANLLHAHSVRDENDAQSGLLVLLDNRIPNSINNACRIMEENIENPVPIQTIAATTGISRRQLDRMFKKFFSATASDVYTSIRLSRARKLLRSTHLALTTISEMCGFTSYPHFSREYRKMYGWSPKRERILPGGAKNTELRLMPSFDLHPDQTHYAPDKLL